MITIGSLATIEYLFGKPANALATIDGATGGADVFFHFPDLRNATAHANATTRARLLPTLHVITGDRAVLATYVIECRAFKRVCWRIIERKGLREK